MIGMKFMWIYYDVYSIMIATLVVVVLNYIIIRLIIKIKINKDECEN